MADFIRLDKENEHRAQVYGSTNPSSIVGTGYGVTKMNKFSVYVEKTRGMTQDFSGQPEYSDGNVFQDGIAQKGISRLAELGVSLPGEWRTEEDMKDVREDGTKVLRWTTEIKASEEFSAKELQELGIPVDLAVKANASPDVEFFKGPRSRKPYAVAEVKMRAYADSRFKNLLSNDPMPGLPGAGKPWYGEELTNEVLPSEYDQCQWHLLNTGLDVSYLFACFNMMTSSVKVYVVNRDEKRISFLKREVLKFHWRHVVNGEEPSLERSSACDWYVRSRDQVTGHYREATSQETELVIRFVEAGAIAAKAKKEAYKLSLEMIDTIGKDKGISFGQDWGRVGLRKGKTGKSVIVTQGLNSELISEESKNVG